MNGYEEKLSVWLVPKGLFDRKVKCFCVKKTIKSLLLVIRKLKFFLCQPKHFSMKKCYYLTKRKCLNVCVRHQNLIGWIITLVRSGLTLQIVLRVSSIYLILFWICIGLCTLYLYLILFIDIQNKTKCYIKKTAFKSCLQNVLFFSLNLIENYFLRGFLQSYIVTLTFILK